MPLPKLTPEQKLLLQKVNFWKGQFQKVKTAFSFKQISTFGELLQTIGLSSGEIEYAYSREQLSQTLTYENIKTIEANWLWIIQHNVWKETEYDKNPVQEHEYEGITYPSSSSQTSSLISLQHISQESFQSDQSKTSEPQIDWDNFFISPEQTARLRGAHQRLTAQQLYIAFHNERKRAMLLEGGAGNGKTYVCGAVVRKLFDDPDFFAHCLSPWPVLWITRASIVEQTKRVVENDFGLCPHTEVIVINVEQLRAKFGKYMVDDKTIVKGGEEHIIWSWKPKYHPKMFIVDECQLAKNEDSTQAKIISSLNEIKEQIHILFMSATPFTRVSEARYFAVNCGLDINL
jgi:hypothetical protein